jgi:septum site-determining protein MinD
MSLGMSEAIVFTSGKGGVGKTTLLANIGVALAGLGFKTVLLDADIGLRNLDIVLGIENKIRFNVVDIAHGICTIEQALVKDHRSGSNLSIIAASQSHLKEDLSKEAFRQIILQLKNTFDYILIDCPAGIEYGFKNAIRSADRAIVIVNPEVSSIRDADRVIGILELEKIKKIQLIVNRYQHDLSQKMDMISVKDIVELLGIKLLGVIPEDISILLSSNEGKPISYRNKHPMYQFFFDIAKSLAGQKELPTQDFAKSKTESLWKKVKRSFTMNR